MAPSFDQLLRAAKDNAVKDMERLLAEGLSPSMANKIGQTGLHVAAIWGNTEVAYVLLKAGADVDAVNQFGLTPLFGAAQGGRYEVAQLLLDFGASVTVAANNGMKPYEAAKEQRMRQLLGAPSLKLHDAVLDADNEAMKMLLAEGISISEQDPDGETRA